jgi:uncharacterized cupredoxin-like copper-binding protein
MTRCDRLDLEAELGHRQATGMRRVIVRKVLAVGVLVTAVASLAVVVPALSAPKAAKATTITVTAGKPVEFAFALSKKKIPVGVVTFKVVNRGKLAHDFKISAKKTKQLSPGQSATIKVTYKKAGTVPFLCTLPGHAAGGMKGVIKLQ